jgi:cell division protein FtsW
MTSVAHRRRPVAPEMEKRRRAAYDRAQKIRSGEGRTRSRYLENVTRDPKPLGFYIIGAVTLVLVFFGLVMVLSASSIVSFHRGGSPWKFFARQTVWAGVGTIGLVLAYRFPLGMLHKVARVLPVFGLGGMLLAFMPGLGISVNGARAWIRISDHSFQPSEFMKLFIVIYGADLLSRREKEMGDLRRTMLPFLAVAGSGAGLAVVQGDIGSSLVMSGIAGAVLFLSGAPLRPLMYLLAGAGSLGMLVVLQNPDKFARFTSFLDIEGTREHDGYQVFQALISLSNGGLTGTGIGAGSGKWGYVPLAHSDFIFSILAEEMGFLGVVGLLTLFAFLIYFGLQAALSCRTRFGMLVAGGISAWLLIQIVINVGGVVGILPVTGLTLPFISFGGTSLIVSMVCAGLLMNVARRPR